MADKEKEVEAGSIQEEASGASSAETEKPDKLMVPKDRLDQEIGKRKTLEARFEVLEAKESKAAKDALAEQGKFEELYKTQLDEAKKAQGELATMKHDSLRRDIATKAGYPQFWNRIQGDGEDALKADMDVFTAGLPKAAAPDIDAGTKSGKRTSEQDTSQKMTKSERNYYASVLNVPEEHLPDSLDI